MASFFVIMPSLSTIFMAFIWVMIFVSSSSDGWAFAAWPRPRAIPSASVESTTFMRFIVSLLYVVGCREPSKP